MRRAPAIAALVAGCVLAAAAAAGGPYLTRTREADVRRTLDAVLRREVLVGADDNRSLVETTLDAALMVVIALGLLYGVYVFLRLLWALATLRLRTPDRRATPPPYEEFEESREDAQTQLRRRVVDELAALSADLDALPDPREAVIACYVRMEAAFAAAGVARTPDESPLELVARVLTSLAVPEADVRRLTALFSEARFSRHAVTEDMRDAARRSLRNVAAALAVPA